MEYVNYFITAVLGAVFGSACAYFQNRCQLIREKKEREKHLAYVYATLLTSMIVFKRYLINNPDIFTADVSKKDQEFIQVCKKTFGLDKFLVCVLVKFLKEPATFPSSIKSRLKYVFRHLVNDIENFETFEYPVEILLQLPNETIQYYYSFIGATRSTRKTMKLINDFLNEDKENPMNESDIYGFYLIFLDMLDNAEKLYEALCKNAQISIAESEKMLEKPMSYFVNFIKRSHDAQSDLAVVTKFIERTWAPIDKIEEKKPE